MNQVDKLQAKYDLRVKNKARATRKRMKSLTKVKILRNGNRLRWNL